MRFYALNFVETGLATDSASIARVFFFFLTISHNVKFSFSFLKILKITFPVHS